MRSSPRYKLSESAIRVWRITTVIFMLFFIIIAFILLMIAVLEAGFSKWALGSIMTILILLAALGISFIPKIRWQRWYYEIDEHEVDLQSGLLIITRTLVPVKRVQHVDTRQGPLLRFYGLADVTISTAATTHRIPVLDEETADNLRDQISKFARLAKEDV